MNSERDVMRAALQEVVVPLLRSRGFSGSFPNFRRARNEELDLLSFQFWKSGGSFIVEMAVVPRGPYQMYEGSIVPEAELETACVDLDLRARLHADTSEQRKWFSYKKSLFRRGPNRFQTPAGHVAALLPQVDAWWAGSK